MVKTDVLEEIKVLCVREKTTLNKALKDVCYRSSFHRTINEGKVVAKNILAIADKLGYDIEIRFVKRGE